MRGLVEKESDIRSNEMSKIADIAAHVKQNALTLRRGFRTGN